MKRVLLVDHTPFAGGAELALVAHIRELDRARFTPLVACTDRTPFLVDEYRKAGAEVHLVRMERLKLVSPAAVVRLIRSSWALRTLIVRERVDLVVANTSRAAYSAALAVLFTNVPLIWWVRDFLYGRGLFRLLSKVPRKIIHVSRAIQAYYGQTGSSKSVVAYVSSDLHRYQERISDQELADARAEWGLKPTDTVIGFMGRLVRDKGPQDLLSAVQRLHKQYPDVKLLLVGTGRGQEGDVEPALRRAVEGQELDYVVMTGYRTNEALYYRLFDMFVLSTREAEPFATSVVQAMMAGKPVVATSSGGTPEIVYDGQTGMLVPPSNPDALAQAIRTLLEDSDLAKRIAQAGYEHAMASYRHDVVTRQIEEIYSEVVQGERERFHISDSAV